MNVTVNDITKEGLHTFISDELESLYLNHGLNYVYIEHDTHDIKPYFHGTTKRKYNEKVYNLNNEKEKEDFINYLSNSYISSYVFYLNVPDYYNELLAEKNRAIVHNYCSPFA